MGSRSPASAPGGSSWGRQLKLLLLINALPLAAMAYGGIALYRGTLRISDIAKRLPAGLGENLVVIGGLFLILLALVGVPLTMLNTMLRDLQRRTIVAAVAWKNIGFGRKLWEIIILFPRWILYVILWLVRTAVILTVFVTLAAMVIFLVRLLSPGFGNDWLPIERVLARIR